MKFVQVIEMIAGRFEIIPDLLPDLKETVFRNA
ncbi:hypothetical protein GGE35_003762 [Rhizobium cellulosilyticum]|uniref:Uncharacterized protein n=1 Tax=Aliirhizobium cellulosilyticum TaxID=393664 RepID=A0A7W6V0Y4_9HYPH|nr:hypothetical protein [Rhizobium cellulosilyticum]